MNKFESWMRRRNIIVQGGVKYNMEDAYCAGAMEMFNTLVSNDIIDVDDATEVWSKIEKLFGPQYD